MKPGIRLTGVGTVCCLGCLWAHGALAQDAPQVAPSAPATAVSLPVVAPTEPAPEPAAPAATPEASPAVATVAAPVTTPSASPAVVTVAAPVTTPAAAPAVAAVPAPATTPVVPPEAATVVAPVTPPVAAPVAATVVAPATAAVASPAPATVAAPAPTSAPAVPANVTTVAASSATDASPSLPQTLNDVSDLQLADVAGWTPVNASTLDAMRGGVDLGNGLVASFGFDRAVYVNGNLVASTSFNIPDIGHITADQASAVAAALNTTNVVQVGPGNSIDPRAFSQASGATVIQNSLNNQNIQALTTLNASVNSLQLFRAMNLQNTLQSALVQSLGH
ncbi:hypothetical protein ACXU4B_01175 [Dyella soli]|uniref:Uncharacterized protein n=1 Tax=Dyella soli TaxID=522319 RepID=A0A4R0YS47_9GAMM|nr:hypothetical protein [Dyella soli]TCI09688.1 hypothetical protein EZM97_12045 [Dyella soli]